MGVELDVTQPLLLPPGAGEIIGDSEDRRVEILSDHEALNVTWSRFGPGREGADPHIHRRHSDLFYVLEGELTVTLGPNREDVAAPAGTLVLAPPLVVHGFRNGSASEEVRYLNFHAPGAGFADYLRGRRDGREVSFDSDDPPADGGRPVEEAILRSGVTPLADVDEIGVIEVQSESGSPAPPHLHRRHLECFCVLAGKLIFTVGGRELKAAAGSWVQVPPGAPHTFEATGSEAARFLDIHAPSCGLGELDQEPA